MVAGWLARAAVLASGVLAGVAGAGDNDLLRVVQAQYRAAERAGHSAAGGRGGADAVQAQYDAARDLQEALAAAEPVSRSCRPLLRALRRFASAQLIQVEGFDRPWPPLSTKGMLSAARASAEIQRVRVRCRPGPAAPPATMRELRTPLGGEAFYGEIRADAPRGTARAEVRIGKHGPFLVDVADDSLRWRVPASVPPGRYSVRVRFELLDDRRTVVGLAESRGVWLLPSRAQRAVRERSIDPVLASRLARVARTFNGHSGIWVHDLSTGRVAGWNSDARFAAASTVKLAPFIGALERYGPRPERSPIAYDLKALAGWSSNAAANRLLVEIGGSESGGSGISQDVLRRLGASSSTYTGQYRLGTALRPSGDITNPPPLISSRVTTAHDLARILFLLHAGATGSEHALGVLRLTRHEARVALGLLLSWQAPPPGDNLGLFRPALGRGVPLAQKNGWFSAVRHTAALVYAASGPKIAVVLTYRPGLGLREAQDFGARVLAIVDR
ncbi:MAG: serine hydrolase [Gaiellaceae bacterium]